MLFGKHLEIYVKLEAELASEDIQEATKLKKAKELCH